METKTKPVRLSPVMVNVLVAMATGTRLKSSTMIDGRAWLDTKEYRGDTVSSSTVFALAQRGLITTVSERFPVRTYGLTAKGKTLAAEYTK